MERWEAGRRALGSPALGAGGVRVVQVPEEPTGLAREKGLNSILGCVKEGVIYIPLYKNI